jgi:polar amino acid transport system substrate-binding protein
MEPSKPSRLVFLLVFLLCPGEVSIGSERQELIGTNSPQALIITGNSDNPPFIMLDKEREAAGIVVDIWRLWSQKTGRPVRFLLTDSQGSLDALKRGRAHIHANLTSKAAILRTSQRLSW